MIQFIMISLLIATGMFSLGSLVVNIQAYKTKDKIIIHKSNINVIIGLTSFVTICFLHIFFMKINLY
jgi:hypothetical protein